MSSSILLDQKEPQTTNTFDFIMTSQALFKARFEQALESQQLNIKKIEQLLRRKGVNPEDPTHMASIQRVASTFFRAIDEQQGTPYVFRQPPPLPEAGLTDQNEDLKVDPKPDNLEEDSDQEELDRYIKEIEDAAGQEWEEEEAAEKEQENRIRYWDKEDYRNRQRGRSEEGNDNSEAEVEVWDEEEGSGDDFSTREVKFRREKREKFGRTKSYRGRELDASRKALYDRSRNGFYRDDYREDSFNKSSGRSQRVEFDSGFNKNFGKGFNRAEGYRDIGHRRSKGMGQRISSGSDNDSWVSDSEEVSTRENYVDVGYRRPRGMSERAKSGSDEDFGNKGFISAKGYGGLDYKGSKGMMNKRVESGSDDELDESDEDFGGYNRFSHSEGPRESSRSRLRRDKSESDLESDNGEEPSLAASRDYGYDYANITDRYEKRDMNNGTVGTHGQFKGESSKKNSDESWDSD